MLLAIGRVADAVQALSRAVNLKPDDPDLHARLGHVQAELGRMTEAAAALEASAATHPDDVGVLWEAFRLYERTGRIAEALAAAERIAAIGPAEPEAHIRIGHLSARLGRKQAAIAAFREAIARQPDNAGVYEALAHALADTGALTDAIAAARSAMEMAPREAQFRVTLAHMLLRADDPCAAVTAFESAIGFGADRTRFQSDLAIARGRCTRIVASTRKDGASGSRPSEHGASAPPGVVPARPLIHVAVHHEAARVGDTVTTLPWMLALAERHAADVLVSGKFSDAVRSLTDGMPLVFDAGGRTVTRSYVADVRASWEYAGPRGLHMSQGYFDLADMQRPALPISLPFRASEIDLPPGVVISPFSASERADSREHVRIWFPERWRAVIEHLLAAGVAARVYVVGGASDDPSPYLTSGVTPLMGQPLDRILALLRATPLFISIDTGLSHVAHFGGIDRHLLLYPEVNFPTLMTNPRATMLRAWPKDIAVESVIDAAMAIIARPQASAADASGSVEGRCRRAAGMMGRFVSLGMNCEFGLLQRRCGIEPLGLFRFGFVPLVGLVAALRDRFAGLSDDAGITVRVDSQREYIVGSNAYGFEFHTLTKTDWETEASIRHHFIRKRLPLLVRMLMEELQAGEKLFVYRGEPATTVADVQPLVEAISGYGPGQLLFVTAAADPSRAGSVERMSERLMVGYLDRLAPLRLATELSVSSWLDVCRHAADMVSGPAVA